jgi:hypothetical protein
MTYGDAANIRAHRTAAGVNHLGIGENLLFDIRGS